MKTRPEMNRQRRLVELPRDAAVEIGVFRRGDIGLRLGPKRRPVGDLGGFRAGLVDDHDRHRHVARLCLDHSLQLEALGVGLGVLHQVKGDAGAALRRIRERRRRHREGALAVRRPQPGLIGAGAAGDHVNAVRHHEGGIEADAELADQRRALGALRRLDPIHEGLGARARDRSQRLGDLAAAHADAVVFDGEGAVVGIDHERDAGLGVVAEQRRIGYRFVAQLLAGIRGVRYQLAQKDVLVGIDRMHHQAQQLGDIGLERPALGQGFFNDGHGRQSLPRTI